MNFTLPKYPEFRVRLQAEVQATNELSSLVNTAAEGLKPVLEKFLNKQITKADGALMKKFETEARAVLDPLQSREVHLFVDASRYVLSLSAKKSYDHPDRLGCRYVKGLHALGRIGRCYLTELYPIPGLKTDFSEEEVYEVLLRMQALSNEFDSCKKQIYSFADFLRLD